MPRSCQVTSGRSANVRQPAKWITATHTAGGDSASQATGLDQRDTQAIVRIVPSCRLAAHKVTAKSRSLRSAFDPPKTDDRRVRTDYGGRCASSMDRRASDAGADGARDTADLAAR